MHELGERLTTPESNFIAIVGDVMTTRACFRAGQTVLSRRFPALDIVGRILAQRVPGTSRFDDFYDDDD